MIISQKCNCCSHEPICAFKEEYLSACESIKNASYGVGGGGVKCLGNSTVDVSIRCPHMFAATQTRELRLAAQAGEGERE